MRASGGCSLPATHRHPLRLVMQRLAFWIDLGDMKPDRPIQIHTVHDLDSGVVRTIGFDNRLVRYNVLIQPDPPWPIGIDLCQPARLPAGRQEPLMVDLYKALF
jgi:hypothetical protein